MAFRVYKTTYRSNRFSPKAIQYELKQKKLWGSVVSNWLLWVFVPLLCWGGFEILLDKVFKINMAGWVQFLSIVVFVIIFFYILYYLTHSKKDKKCDQMDKKWFKEVHDMELTDEQLHVFLQERESQNPSFDISFRTK